MEQAEKPNEISVSVRASTRAKRMSIVVRQDGSVIAVRPFKTPVDRLMMFIASRKRWIFDSLKKFSAQTFVPRTIFPRVGKKQYAIYRKQAHALATEKLEHFNKHYRFTYKKVFIKNQKTRWGSCSMKGNLNFNYKIIFLPPELQDYLIVHELCHLQEMNHGRNFWNLVGETIPDYKKLRSQLRTNTWKQPDSVK